MKLRIPKSKWARLGLVVVLAVVGWALFLYVAGLPISSVSGKICPICRASKGTEYILLFRVSSKVNENDEFTQFFLKHADPKHQHIWLGSSVSRSTRTGGMSAHGRPDPLRLHHEAAMGILRSLPDSQTRKAFFEGLYVPNEHSPEGDRVFTAIMALNEVYWEDKDRKDWPEQLRKLDLYPESLPSKR